MSSLLILDHQHVGKLTCSTDRGTSATWADVQYWESDLTPQYAAAAHLVVEAAGVDYQFIDPPSDAPADYWERHKTAGRMAQARNPLPVAYGACHLNVGGGDYGLVGYDPRSRGGERLAEIIGTELRKLDVLDRVRVEALSGPWAQDLGTIQGICRGPMNLSGVLLKPLFLDNSEHQRFIDVGGLALVGRAIARGVLVWMEVSSVSELLAVS